MSRPPRGGHGHGQSFSHTCVCGKRAYSSKRWAKAEMRRTFPGEKLAVYDCPYDERVWHFGHQPEGVRKGLIARADLHVRQVARKFGSSPEEGG